MSVFLTAGQRQTLLEAVLLVMYLPWSRILNHQSAVTPGQVPVFNGGREPAWSLAYIMKASAICLLLLTHATPLAFSFARLKAGRSIAARIAMIAITTSSSMSVKPALPRNLFFEFILPARFESESWPMPAFGSKAKS